jgi:peptide/nickel transport system ATP-binding protein/oligopeptide transport system ATP-binding protein
MTLLDIRNLSVEFHTEEGIVRAVDEVSFDIPRGKTVCLVGESGCGKSVSAYSLLGLVSPPGRVVGGEALLSGETLPGEETGQDLLKLSEKGLRSIRGNRISMIFQEPMTSLNPVFTIGDQIIEAILSHQAMSKGKARRKAISMLEQVKIPAPEQRVDEYPHQLSGGMRQRALIAMALATEPDLLIADEPTTALDVTIQAQILELLKELQADTGLSVLFITHDLGVVAEIADEVVVMYASRVVEKAPARELFANPLHPYTRGLFNSLPSLGGSADGRLKTIEGSVPDPLAFPTGCKFWPRCELAVDGCREAEPELRTLAADHPVACDVIEGDADD